jgi:hypothetical protein
MVEKNTKKMVLIPQTLDFLWSRKGMKMYRVFILGKIPEFQSHRTPKAMNSCRGAWHFSLLCEVLDLHDDLWQVQPYG